jgi:uncharacterized CHY-type Zn-finger protein
MLYICSCCNFETKLKTNYIRHLSTQKHINTFGSNKYCDICKKNYSSIKSFKNHYKLKHSNTNNTCDKSANNSINKTNDISYGKIKDIVDKSNNEVKDEIQEVKTVVTNAISKASALIKYLTLHYQSTPPLKKIKQKECIKFLRIDYNCPEKNNNYDLEKNFVQDFSRKLFIKNICKSILNMVNYKKPDKQSIWNTDCSRFNYVIKTAIDKWDEDKAGIKFTEYVIKPVLDYVLELIQNYRTNFLAKELCNKQYTKEELMDIMRLTGYTYDLQTELNNQTFIKPILRELSPYLRFLESELEEIEQEELEEQEEKEKFEELEKIKDDLDNLITQTNSNSNSNSNSNNSDRYSDNRDSDSDNSDDITINKKKINISTLKKKKLIL